MKRTSILLAIVIMTGFTGTCEAKSKWVALFNGKDLNYTN